jgi:hypothetical protein
MQIDLEPRQHSHLYELKPVTRWAMVPAIAFVALCVYVTGWSVNTWACVVSGGLLTLITILVFPRYWLSRRN